jgi:hypothetical protein
MAAALNDRILTHDYQLEPPDEVIAELQSDVVQLRLRGELTRPDLLRALEEAAHELSLSGDPRCAVSLAALAVLFRMHSEAA